MTQERCDYRYAHNLTTDTPCGPRCDSRASHLFVWEDGRYSMACADHLVIDENASVKPMNLVPLKEARRYFSMDNQGISYSFVAMNIDHCKWLLTDAKVVVFDADNEEIQLDPATPDLIEKADLEWMELTAEQASLKMTISEDGPRGEERRAPLANRELGAWFCSEF